MRRLDKVNLKIGLSEESRERIIAHLDYAEPILKEVGSSRKTITDFNYLYMQNEYAVEMHERGNDEAAKETLLDLIDETEKSIRRADHPAVKILFMSMLKDVYSGLIITSKEKTKSMEYFTKLQEINSRTIEVHEQCKTESYIN